MRIVIALVLLAGVALAQKKKEEVVEYDDDYEYESEPPAKDTPKKDAKDSKNKTTPAVEDDLKEDDETKPKKKLEHPTSIFLKPRNNRAHSKVVTPSPSQKAKPTLPSFIKHPATGGQISTTVTPRPPGAPRVEKTTAAPIKSSRSNSRSTTTTTTQKPKRGAVSSRDSKKASRTTEAPAKEGRKFGGSSYSSKTKAPKSSRFNKGDRDNK